MAGAGKGAPEAKASVPEANKLPAGSPQNMRRTSRMLPDNIAAMSERKMANKDRGNIGRTVRRSQGTSGAIASAIGEARALRYPFAH